MRKFTAFFIFFSIFASAQTKGIVVDENNKPIPYVNIWVENENIGATSEENGQFTINTEDKNKVLVLSSLGFETKKLKVSEAEKVVLKAVLFTIDEVVIGKRIGKLEIEIGDSKKTTTRFLSGKKPWIYAKLFNYETNYIKNPFIKNTIIFTNSKLKNACFKLRIYKVQNDGFPGEDLINEEIIVFVKKGRKENVIDLSKYNLEIPIQGIFIAYEWMLIESNKYKWKHTDYNSNKVINDFDFSPSILCELKERELTYVYSGGKWYKREKADMKNSIEKFNNKVIEPAINLTLSN